jgi:hypothetical protein
MSMLTDKQIEAGAKALAADAALPGGGRKKLARLVGEHLHWFDATEKRGMTWGDISRLLFAAGVRAKNGRPIPIGTLSSTVWRKRQDATDVSVPKPPSAQSRQRMHETKVEYSEPDIRGLKKPAVPRGTSPSKPKQSTSVMTKPPQAKTPANSRSASSEQTLAFMKRAAALRRTQRD